MTIEPINQSTASGTMDANPKDRKLKEACKDFEAVLLDYMFQSMRKTLAGDSILGNSDQKDLYESMYYQEVSKHIAKGKGLGIGDALYRQLQKKI